MVKRFLVLYFLGFGSFLFGCAACQLMTPKIKVDLTLHCDQNQLTNTHIRWRLAPSFADELRRSYDENENNILDSNELQTIKEVFVEYLKPKQMVTRLTYSANINEDNETQIPTQYSGFKLHQSKDQNITFEYEAKTKLTITDDAVLSYILQDDEGYFDFTVDTIRMENNRLYYQENLYLFLASIHFSSTPFTTKTEANVVATKHPRKETNTSIKAIPKEVSPPKEYTLLEKSILKIKALFTSIKEGNNPFRYLLLLFFAYLYGVIHALGPGHGKTLVASYFLSNDRSYLKALFIALAIGLVHTFSAFVLTLVIYFAVNTFLSSFLNDAVYYTTKVSALIIIAIALYLLYQKHRAYSVLQQGDKPTFTFKTQPHVSTCGCASCKIDKNSTDLALIISAGIIPCPGTITVFIFSLSLGLYVAGFLSAVTMSLGMSTIIFFSAILSVTIRQKGLNTNSNMKKYLEYGSLTLILVLGSLMVLA